MIRDMTSGSPLKLIFRFFFPVLLGELLQQLYNIVDTAIVGRFVGVQAFAGITATGALYSLVIGFLLGLCYGFAIPVAQRFGANDMPRMRKYFANAIYLSAAIAILTTLLTVIFTRDFLRLIRTPEDIFGEAAAYISIIFGGMTATMLYNLSSSVLHSVGDTRTPLYLLILSSFVNILLDLLFVLVFKLGVAGAALATVLSQLLAGTLCMYLIFRRYEILRIRGGEWSPDMACLTRLIGIGLPMGLQTALTAVGSIIAQTAVNGMGLTMVAAVGASDKVTYIFSCPFGAIGAAIATYCGQNFGAKRLDRIRQGVRQSMLVMLAYCAAAFIMQRTFGMRIARLFIDPSEVEVLAFAARYLNIAILFFPGFLGIMVYRNALQGLGHSRTAMVAGVFETAARVFVALVLVPAYGFAGACATHPAAWSMGAAFLIPAYLYTLRKLERTVPA